MGTGRLPWWFEVTDDIWEVILEALEGREKPESQAEKDWSGREVRNERQGGAEKALPGDNGVEAAVHRINRTRTECREGHFFTLGKMG